MDDDNSRFCNYRKFDSFSLMDVKSWDSEEDLKSLILICEEKYGTLFRICLRPAKEDGLPDFVTYRNFEDYLLDENRLPFYKIREKDTVMYFGDDKETAVKVFANQRRVIIIENVHVHDTFEKERKSVSIILSDPEYIELEEELEEIDGGLCILIPDKSHEERDASYGIYDSFVLAKEPRKYYSKYALVKKDMVWKQCDDNAVYMMDEYCTTHFPVSRGKAVMMEMLTEETFEEYMHNMMNGKWDERTKKLVKRLNEWIANGMK